MRKSVSLRIEDADRILVLDTIHGGRIIEEELRSLGKEAVGMNPYRTLSPPSRSFDLVISPVHLNPSLLNNILMRIRGAGIGEMSSVADEATMEVITHHDAVREIAIANSMFERVHAVVEVTGTTAKTTVCEMISDLLSRNRVLSLTSAGFRYRSDDSRILPLRLSITPASILKAMRYADAQGLEFEYAIFEVSLGLTGMGDVGVITTLNPDYKIAAGKIKASDAKISSLRKFSGILVVPASFPIAAYDGVLNIASKHLRLIMTTTSTALAFFNLKTLTGSISGEKEFKCDHLFNEFYKNAAEIAIAAALSLGLSPDELSSTLRAVEHRMNVKLWRGRILVDNSNSGTNLRFINHAEMLAERYAHAARRAARAADAARVASEDMRSKEVRERVLIIGEESEYVCEGVDARELKRVIASRYNDFSSIIVVGEKFQDVVHDIRGDRGGDAEKLILVRSLEEALYNAVERTKEDAMIISNVKTWR